MKIQIQAGAATPAPPVGTALGPHGINIMDFCKAYNAADGVAARHGDPGRDHDLRGPLVHVRHQDPADAGAAAPGRRDREGLVHAAPRDGRQGHQGAAPPIAETKMPDVNAIDIEGAMPRSRARPARWASKSSTERRSRPRRHDLGRRPGTNRGSREERTCPVRSTTKRPRRYDRSPAARTRQGVRAGEVALDPQLRRDRSRSRSGSASTPARPTRCCAARCRCRPARARTCASPCSPRATRRTRRASAGADVVGADDLVEAGRGRVPRLRRRDRDPRPHGPGRQARPGARSARPDAQPEDRNRHQRRRQDGLASSRAARSSTAPTASATCTCRSAR